MHTIELTTEELQLIAEFVDFHEELDLEAWGRDVPTYVTLKAKIDQILKDPTQN